MVGKLSTAYEAINVSRGLYLHIDRLGITRQNVIEVAAWGEQLLRGEHRPIDGSELFDLFQSAGISVVVRDAQQLVSMIAKHREVRRLSNNLQLAHRNSLNESELSLAKKDPEIAAQWHPTKNGSTSPMDVRPNSFKKRWWLCPNGHEWQAMPVYRTRTIRSCPGCQDRWSLEKVRLFVKSLVEHVDAFSPSELYVLFQQSGLLNHGGRSKGFVKALVTGRFPTSELEKFSNCAPSVVDNFISDADLRLEDTKSLTTSDRHSSRPSLAESLEEIPIVSGLPSKNAGTTESLPTVSARAAMRAMNSKLIPTSDDEAIEFLIAKKKGQIWSHAYLNESEAVREMVEALGENDYARRVRDDFLLEYQEATDLEIPMGYSFAFDGAIQSPNLMQRHVAVSVREKFRFGNWSGTGAGKTLSAILATRVCNSRLTIICSPNAVVGNESSGWAAEISRVYPDSDVQTKTWYPQWREGSPHRYLILNYEHFQQPSSEYELTRFLETERIDFIVIDEVHFAKQRQIDDMSQRKRLIQAMVVYAGQQNAQLRVLGMSATPVINNL